MITLLSGNDIVGNLNFIKSVRKKYKPENIFEFSGGKFLVNDIINALTGGSIFSGQRLVLVIPENVGQVDLNEKLLKEISSSQDIELVLDAIEINKNTKVYKLIKKHSQVREFPTARDYTSFNIADALFIYKDKKRALDLVNQIEDLDANFYTFVSSIQFALRNFISMKYKNDEWNKLHPFVKKKTADFKLSLDEAKKIYKDLLMLDKDLKTSKAPKLALIQDFVLYSF